MPDKATTTNGDTSKTPGGQGGTAPAPTGQGTGTAPAPKSQAAAPPASEDTPSVGKKGTEDTPSVGKEGQDGQDPNETLTFTRRKLGGYVTRRANKAVAAARAEWEQEQAAERERITQEAQEKAGEVTPLYEKAKAENATLRARVKELEGQLAAYRETVDDELETKIEDWPEEILETDPATLNPNGYTAKERQDWYTRMSKIVARMTTSPTPPAPPAPGNPASPAPASHNGATLAPGEKEYIEQRRRQRGAGGMV